MSRAPSHERRARGARHSSAASHTEHDPSAPDYRAPPHLNGEENERSTQRGHVFTSTRTLGLIMNGVSGRMGVNQHLIRSVGAIRAQGGVADVRRLAWSSSILCW